MTQIKKIEHLPDFIRESNAIEGIYNAVGIEEVKAYNLFLSLNHLENADVSTFAKLIEPRALLRYNVGMNVRVGVYIPPIGGEHIIYKLRDIVDRINSTSIPDPRHAWSIHLTFEQLHPFMDGNGRTGRAIWLYLMGGWEKVPLGFLHTFYYQTLRFEDL